MTVKIGITGGIGSGKSVVSRLLEVMGIPVYISDGETKQLMMTDSCIRSELTALLGEEVYAGGVLNKSLLASYLFGSPEHAGQINGIVHPRVKEDFRQWVCQRAACRMAGIESAILIEAGFADELPCVPTVLPNLPAATVGVTSLPALWHGLLRVNLSLPKMPAGCQTVNCVSAMARPVTTA